MTQISPITSNVVFTTNLVSERIVLHYRNLCFFRKLNIELNNIGKTAQSFFSKASGGLISNPYSLSKIGDAMPVYFNAPTKEEAAANTDFFILQRARAITEVQKNIVETVRTGATVLEKSTGPEEEAFEEIIMPGEQLEKMTIDSEAVFGNYRDALVLTTPEESNYDQLEAGFKAHYSTPFCVHDDRLHDDTYRKYMENAEATVSESLIANIANEPGGKKITWPEVYDQCIDSFREARKDVFYTILRRNPELLSRLGSHRAEAVAQYDADFHTILMGKLGTDYKPNLQNLLMEAHRQTKFRPVHNPKHTPDFLVEFNNKLTTYAKDPLLLSRMATHAVRTIRNRSLIAALPALSAVDREAVANAMKARSMSLEFIRQHWAACQDSSESPEVIHEQYTTAFRDFFLSEFQNYYSEDDRRANPLHLKSIINLATLSANQYAISTLPRAYEYLSDQPLNEFLTAIDAA